VLSCGAENFKEKSGGACDPLDLNVDTPLPVGDQGIPIVQSQIKSETIAQFLSLSSEITKYLTGGVSSWPENYSKHAQNRKFIHHSFYSGYTALQ
jgi:hypothetical protein